MTGYDDLTNIAKPEKVQVAQAETIPGPSTEEPSAYAVRHNMFIIFGMPERDPVQSDLIYNAAAILSPDGSIRSYRKMHCFGDENNWATHGTKPGLIDTP
ncbi:hypothetical protein AGATL06_24940 [Agathobaculum sp. TL06]